MYKNLEKVRKELDLTINDMGKIICKTPATYYKKEIGDVSTTVKEALAISVRLGYSVEFLFLEFWKICPFWKFVEVL